MPSKSLRKSVFAVFLVLAVAVIIGYGAEPLYPLAEGGISGGFSFDELSDAVASDDDIDGEVRAWTENGVRHVVLKEDVVHEDGDNLSSVAVGRDLDLDLDGHKIDAQEAGSVIDIARGCSMVLRDSAGGGSIVNGKAQNVVGGSDAILPNGTGGGVRVQKGARFIMYGGSISGNSATWGAGVELQPDSEFVMRGGDISGNGAGESGGGVNLDSVSRMEMLGGSISGNSSDSYGGGLHANPGGSIVVGGGSFPGTTRCPAEA